jgi:hypothetical protein
MELIEIIGWVALGFVPTFIGLQRATKKFELKAMGMYVKAPSWTKGGKVVGI